MYAIVAKVVSPARISVYSLASRICSGCVWIVYIVNNALSFVPRAKMPTYVARTIQSENASESGRVHRILDAPQTIYYSTECPAREALAGHAAFLVSISIVVIMVAISETHDELN